MVLICDGFDQMNFVKVTAMLSQSYWNKDVKIEKVKQAASNSAIVVGAFLDGEQIGYARAVSDKTKFAYIMDVYVEESYRKQGVGQRLVRYMLEHDTLKDVYIWLLATEDAHGVYEKCGFKPLEDPARWMHIRKPVGNA